MRTPGVEGVETFSYALTQAGTHAVASLLASAGGLHATYFSDPDLTAATDVRMDTTIDFSSVREDAIHDVRMDATIDFSSVREDAIERRADAWPGTPARPITSAGFSVRWFGFVRPEASRTYTFQTRFDFLQAAGTTLPDRVRLWIDGASVIDQWSSLEHMWPSGTFEFPSAERLYDIRIDYSHRGAGTEAPILRLFLESDSTPRVVPSLRLYAAFHTAGSPFTVRVAPGAPSPAATTFTGSYGAGVYPHRTPLSLGLQLRDVFGNPASDPAMFSPLHAFGIQAEVTTPFANYDSPSGLYISRTEATPAALAHTGECSGTGDCDNSYQVQYSVESGATLALVLATRGGLNAKYFRDRALQGAVVDRVDATVDFSYGRGPPQDTEGAVPADSFSVRWQGMVKPTLDSLYTFRTITSPSVGIEGGISRLRYIKIGDELMLATHVDRNSLGHLVPADITVIRGQAGSTATSHPVGEDVTPALPIFDVPLAAGTLVAAPNGSFVTLDGNAPPPTSKLDAHLHPRP
ncbi:hypothetical protein T484DRAFT_1896295 [Baffinella frigidus]|nr:hypothetical protein T484DRAFT_1896295 [Cryptophyta sp. CCMP2293]